VTVAVVLTSIIHNAAAMSVSKIGYMYRVGQIKWHHFTFLLVTN